jgi:hypothetical protein
LAKNHENIIERREGAREKEHKRERGEKERKRT